MSVTSVLGIDTYYERHGAGRPLILLHGGLCSAETFQGMRPDLAAVHEMWVPERRGHGRTRDTDESLTYDAMAAETLAFLDAVGLDSVDVVGHSDGANIGLLLAARSPSRVNRLVSISGNFEVGGMAPPAPGSRGDVEPLFADLIRTYQRLSPDGEEHLSVILEKSNRMWADWTGISMSELGAIECPTLVMSGDADVISLEHTLALYRAVPGAELAVVPGTSHMLMQEKAAFVASLILAFIGS